MKLIYLLFVLSFLLQNTAELKAQEILYLSEDLLHNEKIDSRQSNDLLVQETSFYYDKIVGGFSNQSDGDYLLETLTRQIWDESLSNWVNDSLYDYSYNDMSLVNTLIAHKWRNGNVWGHDGRWRYIYSSSDKLIYKYLGEWYTTYWYEWGRNVYTYYGNGNLFQTFAEAYNGGNWTASGRATYSYNTSNLLSSIISEARHYMYGYWYYTGKYEFYYDSTLKLITKIRFNYSGGGWVNDINDLYFYDTAGNNIENIRQEWNNTGSTWINDYRYLYEYDLNNVLLSIVYQNWQEDSLDWENVWRETYTYTPLNKPATMFKETWTLETGWKNYVFRTYFYDINNNWTEKLTQLWDETNWKNYYRHLATWLEPVSVQEENPISNLYYLYNNFPNPFNPATKIRFQIPNPGLISLKVYDLLGNEIITLVNEEKSSGEYEVEFKGEGLSSGMYFYTLRAGDFSETKKMVLLK